MTFDPTKPARTKSGLPARFLGKLDNPKAPYPLIFAVGEPLNEEDWRYTLNGEFWQSGQDHNRDLENIPVKHTKELWLTAWIDGSFTLTELRPNAINKHNLIACKQVTVQFEEGEGL